jgi:cytochrome c
MACMACHTTGAGGAPKIGDAAAWTDRISQGQATLVQHAINGFQGNAGYMPAKGGRADLTDDEVSSAVDYMIEKSK